LSEGNLPSIAKTIELLYGGNARAEMTSALTCVILDATLLPTRAPSRVVTDVALLLAVLHCRVGCEVTAAFLHELIDRYQRLFDGDGVTEAGKQMGNALLLLARLYSFKVSCIKEMLGSLVNCRGTVGAVVSNGQLASGLAGLLLYEHRIMCRNYRKHSSLME